MNIKVAAFTASEKSINTPFEDTYIAGFVMSLFMYVAFFKKKSWCKNCLEN